MWNGVDLAGRHCCPGSWLLYGDGSGCSSTGQTPTASDYCFLWGNDLESSDPHPCPSIQALVSPPSTPPAPPAPPPATPPAAPAPTGRRLASERPTRRLSSHAGCKDPAASDYDPDATQQSSCSYPISGCTDPTALNHNAVATIDAGDCTFPPSPLGCVVAIASNFDSSAVGNDDSCRFVIYGCTDSAAANYVATATVDSGHCVHEVPGCTVSVDTVNFDSLATSLHGCRYLVRGCTDSSASNYYSLANVESGTCEWYVSGCLAPSALNYNANATRDDGSCLFPLEGCTDSTYTDYLEHATSMRAGGCVGTVYRPGCTSVAARNYDADATIYDGSCVFDVSGCTDSSSARYNPSATRDDGSCAWSSFGCTDSASACYSSAATVDDGSCLLDGCFAIRGCTDWNALNYLSSATYNDGSCLARRVGCSNVHALNYDPNVTVASGASCVFPLVGCTDSRAENYVSWATADTSPSMCAVQVRAAPALGLIPLTPPLPSTHPSSVSIRPPSPPSPCARAGLHRLGRVQLLEPRDVLTPLRGDRVPLSSRWLHGPERHQLQLARDGAVGCLRGRGLHRLALSELRAKSDRRGEWRHKRRLRGAHPRLHAPRRHELQRARQRGRRHVLHGRLHRLARAQLRADGHHRDRRV